MDIKNYRDNHSDMLKELYLSDINKHIKDREEERFNKINNEKEYNMYLRSLLAEEQKKNYLLKQHKNNVEREEYNKWQIRKKLEEDKNADQKIKDRELLGLNIDPEANFYKQKNIIGTFNEKMVKNNLSHDSFLKNNLNNKDQISNMFKNLSNPNEIQINKTPLNNNMINLANKSISLDNTINKEIKQYNKVEFDKKYEEDYIDYKNIAKSFNNYNKNISEKKYKENSYDERQLGSNIRLEDLKKQNQINEELKQNKYFQQQIYKTTLDNQQVEKMFYSPQGKRIKDNYLGVPKDHIEHSFLDRNNPVSVAPYSTKKYEIGGTILDHNPIINPVVDYKYNKYLYQYYSPFRFADRGLIGK